MKTPVGAHTAVLRGRLLSAAPGMLKVGKVYSCVQTRRCHIQRDSVLLLVCGPGMLIWTGHSGVGIVVLPDGGRLFQLARFGELALRFQSCED